MKAVHYWHKIKLWWSRHRVKIQYFIDKQVSCLEFASVCPRRDDNHSITHDKKRNKPPHPIKTQHASVELVEIEKDVQWVKTTCRIQNTVKFSASYCFAFVKCWCRIEETFVDLMVETRGQDSPDVIQVADFILLQYTPSHFFHLLHYQQTHQIWPIHTNR